MDHFLVGPLADIPLELCGEGMSLKFACGIAKICEEIRLFYDIEESVRMPNNDDLLEFLYDLSSFLLELECPHENLSCGDILTRFQIPQNCEFLLQFLVAELKAARLFGQKKIESGKLTSSQKDLELTPLIDSTLNVLKIPKQPGTTNEWRVLELLTQKVDQKSSQSRREPIFMASVDDKSLAEIENLCQVFSRDFNNRLLLLSRRLKVTVESFLWCDRVNSRKEEVRNILTDSLKNLENIKSNCDFSHILAASSSLLYVVKASEQEHRTKSKQHPLSLGEAPKDRGGRTTEMAGLRNETYSSQNSNRGGGRGHGYQRGGRGQGYQNRGGRGNHRGNHRGNRGGHASHEQQVLQQVVDNDRRNQMQ